MLRGMLAALRRVWSPERESDVTTDEAVATSRHTGGDPAREQASTTGPGEHGTFVGRIAGEDDGAQSEPPRDNPDDR